MCEGKQISSIESAAPDVPPSPSPNEAILNIMKQMLEKQEDGIKKQEETNQIITESLLEISRSLTNIARQLNILEKPQVDINTLQLHGLVQYSVQLFDNEKNQKLFYLMDQLKFEQAVVFVGTSRRCTNLIDLFQQLNFGAVGIHREMQQEERLARYKEFQKFKTRILVATDLFGLGMDMERVNIVFNYDMPENTDTYLHRVGRVGHIGTKRLAITFVANESDAAILNEVQTCFEVRITEIPDKIDVATYIENP